MVLAPFKPLARLEGKTEEKQLFESCPIKVRTPQISFLWPARGLPTKQSVTLELYTANLVLKSKHYNPSHRGGIIWISSPYGRSNSHINRWATCPSRPNGVSAYESIKPSMNGVTSEDLLPEVPHQCGKLSRNHSRICGAWHLRLPEWPQRVIIGNEWFTI
ncbi:hypothetical protein Tco_1093745 [Tanacetum coccineum]|uniref:Uncharacterized protein n=1 Tax=Tanacetum coccineum TaxID=301880 RepID=A0ABQ5IFY5_9ASTR